MNNPDWGTSKSVSISNAALVILHDFVDEMGKQNYQNSVTLTKAQKHAFDELCSACEPINDTVFTANYDQLLRSAEDHLNRRFEE